MSDVIRVVHADGSPSLRMGVRRLLEVYAAQLGRRVAVVGEAGTAAAALELVRTASPDVLITDLDLVGTSGVELVRAVREAKLDTRVLVLAAHGAPTSCIGTLRELGVGGFITKEKPPMVVAEAVCAVADGEARWFAVPRQATALDLTASEARVLDELVKGRSNVEIAAALSISEHTVRNHLTSVYGKLEVSSARQAIVKALGRSVSAASVRPGRVAV